MKIDELLIGFRCILETWLCCAFIFVRREIKSGVLFSGVCCLAVTAEGCDYFLFAFKITTLSECFESFFLELFLVIISASKKQQLSFNNEFKLLLLSLRSSIQSVNSLFITIMEKVTAPVERGRDRITLVKRGFAKH